MPHSSGKDEPQSARPLNLTFTKRGNLMGFTTSSKPEQRVLGLALEMKAERTHRHVDVATPTCFILISSTCSAADSNYMAC